MILLSTEMWTDQALYTGGNSQTRLCEREQRPNMMLTLCENVERYSPSDGKPAK